MRIPATFLFCALLFLTAEARSAEVGKNLPPVIENSLGMKFVIVPAGEFMMGSDESPEALAKAFPQYDRWRFLNISDEAPVHKVRITRSFYLGQHEVTVGQFKKFLAASGYLPESVADGTGGYGYNPAYDPKTSKRGDAFRRAKPSLFMAESWFRSRGRSSGGQYHLERCLGPEPMAQRKGGEEISPADRG